MVKNAMLIIFLRDLFKADTWIADEPEELNDEKNYGILASDISRKIKIFPGLVQSELERMVAQSNPLATKFTELAKGGFYSPNDTEFRELCGIVDQRLASQSPK